MRQPDCRSMLAAPTEPADKQQVKEDGADHKQVSVERKNGALVAPHSAREQPVSLSSERALSQSIHELNQSNIINRRVELFEQLSGSSNRSKWLVGQQQVAARTHPDHRCSRASNGSDAERTQPCRPERSKRAQKCAKAADDDLASEKQRLLFKQSMAELLALRDSGLVDEQPESDEDGIWVLGGARKQPALEKGAIKRAAKPEGANRRRKSGSSPAEDDAGESRAKQRRNSVVACLHSRKGEKLVCKEEDKQRRKSGANLDEGCHSTTSAGGCEEAAGGVGETNELARLVRHSSSLASSLSSTAASWLENEHPHKPTSFGFQQQRAQLQTGESAGAINEPLECSARLNEQAAVGDDDDYYYFKEVRLAREEIFKSSGRESVSSSWCEGGDKEATLTLSFSGDLMAGAGGGGGASGTMAADWAHTSKGDSMAQNNNNEEEEVGAEEQPQRRHDPFRGCTETPAAAAAICPRATSAIVGGLSRNDGLKRAGNNGEAEPDEKPDMPAAEQLKVRTLSNHAPASPKPQDERLAEASAQRVVVVVDADAETTTTTTRFTTVAATDAESGGVGNFQQPYNANSRHDYEPDEGDETEEDARAADLASNGLDGCSKSWTDKSEQNPGERRRESADASGYHSKWQTLSRSTDDNDSKPTVSHAVSSPNVASLPAISKPEASLESAIAFTEPTNSPTELYERSQTHEPKQSKKRKGLVRQVSRLGKSVYNKLKRKLNASSSAAAALSSGQDSPSAAALETASLTLDREAQISVDEKELILGEQQVQINEEGKLIRQTKVNERVVLVESREVVWQRALDCKKKKFAFSDSSADNSQTTSITTPLLTLTRPSCTRDSIYGNPERAFAPDETSTASVASNCEPKREEEESPSVDERNKVDKQQVKPEEEGEDCKREKVGSDEIEHWCEPQLDPDQVPASQEKQRDSKDEDDDDEDRQSIYSDTKSQLNYELGEPNNEEELKVAADDAEGGCAVSGKLEVKFEAAPHQSIELQEEEEEDKNQQYQSEEQDSSRRKQEVSSEPSWQHQKVQATSSNPIARAKQLLVKMFRDKSHQSQLDQLSSSSSMTSNTPDSRGRNLQDLTQAEQQQQTTGYSLSNSFGLMSLDGQQRPTSRAMAELLNLAAGGE